MKTADDCIINGLHVVNVEIIANIHASPSMKAEYALVHRRERHRDLNTTNCNTHGKCIAGPGAWSKETLECLKALLDSMEQDLVGRHFDDGKGVEQNEPPFIGSDQTPSQI